MADIDPHELLTAPVSDFAADIATGIARAQKALDDAALALWKQLNTDPALAELKEIGYQPTWYAIPVAEAEIKMTFYFEKGKGAKSRLFALPFNAKTQSTTKLREEGTSQLKLRIVPVPPPVGASVQKDETP